MFDCRLVISPGMNTIRTTIAILYVITSSGVQSSNPNDGLCDTGHYMDYDSHTCSPCPMNTFSSTRNRAAQCEPCSKKCFGEQRAEVLYPCNSTHNLTCRCKPGYYATTDRSPCRHHGTCPPDCTKQPGTPSSNTVCYEPCPTSVSNSHAGYTTTPSKRDVKEPVSSQTVSMPNVIASSSISPLNNSADDTVNKESRTIEPNTSQSNVLAIVLATVLSIFAVATAAVIFILKRRGCGKPGNDYQEVPYNGRDVEPGNNTLQPPPPLPDRTLYSNGRLRQQEVIHDGENVPLENGVGELHDEGPSGDNGQEGPPSAPAPHEIAPNDPQHRTVTSVVTVNNGLLSLRPGYSRAGVPNDSALRRPVANVLPQLQLHQPNEPQVVPPNMAGNPPPIMNQPAPGPGNPVQVHEVEAVLEQNDMD